jgi:hypothetical protein
MIGSPTELDDTVLVVTDPDDTLEFAVTMMGSTAELDKIAVVVTEPDNILELAFAVTTGGNETATRSSIHPRFCASYIFSRKSYAILLYPRVAGICGEK